MGLVNSYRNFAMSSELNLKKQLKGKLHGTRAAHLIERVQNTQRVCKSRCRLAKSILPETRIYHPEIRMVKNVESFGSELQFEIFVDWKFAAYCHVHLPGAKAAGKGSRDIAQTGTCSSKSIRVNGPASGAWEGISKVSRI